MLVSKNNDVRIRTSFICVSILVLMDVGLKVYKWNWYNINILLFQSLFWWMLVSKFVFFSKLADVFIVSILVLMDVGLKAPRSKQIHFPGKCFNPCSDGCWSQRTLIFLGEEVFNRFQSLFWWMLVSKLSNLTFSILSGVCFNPCSDRCWSLRYYFVKFV